MISFQLFGYPVKIQGMFWLLCAFLGMNALQTPGPEGIIHFVSWVVVVLVSILWHEFGHAFARRKFRAPHSEIVLHGFGGYCTGPGNFSRNEHMMISFAGPLASFILGGLIYFLLKPLAYEIKWLRYLVFQGLWVNFGWGLLNLLPVFPLDGGQIFSAFMSNKKPSVVPIVGMVVAGAMAVYGLSRGSLWMAFIFGMLAFQNWQHSQGVKPNRFFLGPSALLQIQKED